MYADKRKMQTKHETPKKNKTLLLAIVLDFEGCHNKVIETV
jgi:hypothetical protein